MSIITYPSSFFFGILYLLSCSWTLTDGTRCYIIYSSFFLLLFLLPPFLSLSRVPLFSLVSQVISFVHRFPFHFPPPLSHPLIHYRFISLSCPCLVTLQ
ncbi:hypothetical protein BDZ97DRAFT_1800062 [Flammula alnicola]|nr:hypothetical protein BDZ97DRAFT_1800062 [Flammula alnicola]